MISLMKKFHLMFYSKGITEAIISKKIGSCEERYPVFCEDSNETFDSCITGLISCDESTGHCPIFFSGEATQKSDQIKGAITLAIALLVITSCLYGMMFLIYRMLVETPVGIIARCSSFNTYVLMIYGCAFGLLLGNSSATESMLTPFVGMGIIELDQVKKECCHIVYCCMITPIHTKYVFNICVNFCRCSLGVWVQMLDLLSLQYSWPFRLGRNLLCRSH